jgi:hypothetical protein
MIFGNVNENREAIIQIAVLSDQKQIKGIKAGHCPLIEAAGVKSSKHYDLQYSPLQKRDSLDGGHYLDFARQPCPPYNYTFIAIQSLDQFWLVVKPLLLG